MTRMGKTTSPKTAFLAKLEFSEVCSRFKRIASSSHSLFPWFWPCLWFEKEGEPTWLSDEGEYVRDPYIAERNRHFVGPLAEGPHRRNPRLLRISTMGLGKLLTGKGRWSGGTITCSAATRLGRRRGSCTRAGGMARTPALLDDRPEC